MTELSEIINVPPKRRITIPEHHVALILPTETISDLKSMCLLLRKGARFTPEDKFSIREIAGEVLLAIMEIEG